MKHGWVRLLSTLFLAAMLATVSTLAYGQGSATSSLTGTVTDSSGGVVPGVDVVMKNNATGETFTAVSGTDGGFTIPAVPPGTYTVTVALQGFKTVVLNDVVLNAAVPASVKPVLELGKVEETVVVAAATEIVQTQTSAVANTINSKQLSNLPLPGRAAFDFVSLLPGVTTTDGSTRGAQVNGLPTALVNITLDGMNIQDNYAKTWDGMFTRVSPRLDAVEEVTVGTAAQGADMAGQGGVQVKFVTRSGTNQFRGSAYYYLRRDWMNTNTYWNTYRNFQPKPVMAQYQPGGRLGGPIVIPGLFDGHDKAFFFFNYEDLRQPGTNTATRTIMTENAQHGLFQRSNGQLVDLMALARANGQVSTIDPTVAKLLAGIRGTTSQGTLAPSTDGLVQQFTWQQATSSVTKYPTGRLDYNISARHRVSASLTYNHLVSDPDTGNGYQAIFPGFAVHGMQDSYRWTSQLSMRSIVSKNMVNEVRVGGTGGATYFAPDLTPDMFDSQNGYSLGISAFRSISNPNSITSNSAREGYTRVVEDTLNWIRGAHSLSIGGSFTNAGVWYRQQQQVPTINLNMTTTGDPADAMFAANFSGNDLNYAKSLYAVLTGRVSSIGRNARINEAGDQYVFLGPSLQTGRINQIGFFLQDSWRLQPSVTLNAGVRYDIQTPFYSLNNSYSTATMADVFGVTGVGSGFVAGSTVTNLGNLFKPGTLEGTKTTYQMLTKDTSAYKTDWNNVAPSIGLAWKLPEPKNFLRYITGTDAVLRGGYNLAYQRGGMSDFTMVYGSNPGVSIDATRNQTNGNLGNVPLLLSTGDLGVPGNVPTTRTYPMAVPSASSSVYIFDPNIKVPYSSSFTIGMQRALNKTTAVEARFIHTGSKGAWTIGQWNPYNYNEVNIVENNFVNEFRVAQANLQANIAAGKGNTFAYTGAKGTSPLPTFLAYLNASTDVNNPKAYSGSNWTSSTLVNTMYPLNPNPRSAATTLATNATYKKNGVTANYPANWFQANPDVNGAYVVTNGPDTRYNGVQLELRRRFSQGLQLTANYTFGKAYQSTFYGFHKPMVEIEQNYTSIWSNSPNGNATGNVRHVFATSYVYELPFGQGKRFGGNVGRNLNRVIGNWTWMGTARIQSGRMVDFGNVRLVGMTPDDVRNAFELRTTTDVSNDRIRTRVWMLPQDIIDNTRKAFDVDANGYRSGAPTGRYFAPANGPDCVETTAGYGDCGIRSLIVTGPKVVRVDMSLGKQVLVTSRVSFEFQAQVFNVFNRVNFNPNVYTGTVLDSYEVTGSVDSSRTGQLALRISF